MQDTKMSQGCNAATAPSPDALQLIATSASRAGADAVDSPHCQVAEHLKADAADKGVMQHAQLNNVQSARSEPQAPALSASHIVACNTVKPIMPPSPKSVLPASKPANKRVQSAEATCPPARASACSTEVKSMTVKKVRQNWHMQALKSHLGLDMWATSHDCLQSADTLL